MKELLPCGEDCENNCPYARCPYRPKEPGPDAWRPSEAMMEALRSMWAERARMRAEVRAELREREV